MQDFLFGKNVPFESPNFGKKVPQALNDEIWKSDLDIGKMAICREVSRSDIPLDQKIQLFSCVFGSDGTLFCIFFIHILARKNAIWIRKIAKKNEKKRSKKSEKI